MYLYTYVYIYIYIHICDYLNIILNEEGDKRYKSMQSSISVSVYSQHTLNNR